MLDEKPNSDFHWKSKLEKLESLPGETFNKETAWEKLHQRMQGKPRNKRAAWYWAAAASLIVALIIPWLFFGNKERNKENVLVKNNSVQKQTQSSSSRLLQAAHKDTSVVSSSLSTKEKLPALSIEKNNKINSSIKHDIIPFEIVQGKKEKEESIVQKITNNAMVPVDPPISIVAILPEKKKLQVVHINELGDPVAETPNTARNYEHHSFQVRLINQEVFTNPPSSGNTGFNIFKAKPSPSN